MARAVLCTEHRIHSSTLSTIWTSSGYVQDKRGTPPMHTSSGSPETRLIRPHYLKLLRRSMLRRRVLQRCHHGDARMHDDESSAAPVRPVKGRHARLDRADTAGIIVVP